MAAIIFVTLLVRKADTSGPEGAGRHFPPPRKAGDVGRSEDRLRADKVSIHARVKWATAYSAISPR